MSQEGYCPACLSRLTPTTANFKAVDFACEQCGISFQLKSTKSKIGTRVPDGAYDAMVAAVRSDASPALVLMRYDLSQWMVRDLIVIPSFALTEQAIIPRKPLSMTARRAGWIGCNIDLSRIAPDARVRIIDQGTAISRQLVADRYARLKPLQSIQVSQRGWALAVLNGIQTAGWMEFTTQDAYKLEIQMIRLFPGNRNIRPKIRQQLQVLRDLGILKHLDRGHWMISAPDSSPTTPQTN
jgi:type II restriction enzyme